MDVSGFPSGSFPVLKISVRKDTLMDAAQGTACALCASPVSRRVSLGRKRLLSQAMLTLGLALACVLQGHAQQMAITFDDLPLHGPMAPGQTRLEIAQSILKTLAANHMPPTYGFVNGFRVPRYPETLSVLEAWRNAGQLLGNHTWSHPDIDDVSADAFIRNIAHDEALLERLQPHEDWHWFRYPFLHEGDTLAKRHQVRVWLKDHGYRVAEVNMDFEDWRWNDSYGRCAARHDKAAIQRLHDTYLATAGQYITFFRGMSQQVYGRDVKYILLLHLGAFDARMLPELLELYRSRGFTFITLPEAEADPAYQADPNMADPSGGTLMEQMISSHTMDYPPDKGKPEKELDRICR
jgi:peptidoglycan/xylan/chitin deacetylase (PgdA/CDA1 family)